MARQQIKVLLLEDDPISVRLIERVLNASPLVDFRLVTAGELARALECLSTDSFDLILSDLSLPDSYGLETFHALRSKAQDIPIVVLTSTNDDEVAITAVQSGAQDYFVKGAVDYSTLVSSIRYGIERASMMRALRDANDELEKRVATRTAELVALNQILVNENQERRKAEDNLHRRNKELSALNNILSTVAHSLDMNELLLLPRRILTEQPGIVGGAVFLTDRVSNRLRFQSSWGLPLSLTAEMTSSGAVWLYDSANLSTPEYRSGRFANLLATSANCEELKSCISIPLAAKGHVLGTIDLFGSEADTFALDTADFLKAIGLQIAIALHNAQLFEEATSSRERLRSLSRRLVEVQETERRHLAKELHDEVGQLLTGLRLAVESMPILPSDKLKERSNETRELINRLISEVRELSLNLRPAMLDDLGLLPALIGHFERFAALSHIDVAFRHHGIEGKRFRPEIENAAYRIVQEALTNVTRYAGVMEAAVHVWADSETICVQIEDQGKGFDPSISFQVELATGLSGMRERAELLGGQFELDTRPGRGTCITAILPVKQDAEVASLELSDDFNCVSG